MSGFDLNVWFSNTHLTGVQAAAIVRHVGADWVIFAHDPRVDSFLTELRRRYPDLSSGDAVQDGQWGTSDAFLQSVDDPRPPPPTAAQMSRRAQDDSRNVWNGGISQQGLFTSMSIYWEKAAEVFPYVQTLAKKYQLTVLDEDDNLQQPQTTTIDTPDIFRLSLTLHIAGKAPALDASITQEQTVIAHEVVSTRLAAHKLAQMLAGARHEIGYHLDDQRCLAQAYGLVPVNMPNMTSDKGQLYELKRLTPP